MTYKARVPEATVFVHGRRIKHARLVIGLNAYAVQPTSDASGRRLAVTRYHDNSPVDSETRATVLERFALDLIAPSQPTKGA